MSCDERRILCAYLVLVSHLVIRVLACRCGALCVPVMAANLLQPGRQNAVGYAALHMFTSIGQDRMWLLVHSHRKAAGCAHCLAH
jgi:hypothetical protein